MAEPIHVTDGAFEQAVLKSKTPVLVDFWAEWCPPCKAIAPTLEALAGEYDGKMIVAKINTDDNPQSPMMFGIQSIPTLLFVRDGQVVDRIVGAAPRPMIKARIEKLIAA